MKLRSTFFRGNFISALFLSSQLLSQEAPQIAYHTHIAPLEQHAAQVIAQRFYKESFTTAIEARGSKNNCIFIPLYKALETLQNISYEGEPAAQIITPKGCIAKDNPDALAYCFNQTFAGHDKKTTLSLKNLAEYAVDKNAPGCLQLLLSHVDSPGQLITEKSFIKAIINGYVLCTIFLLPYNNPEVVYQGSCSPLEQAFSSLEKAEKDMRVSTSIEQEELSKKTCDYKHMITFFIKRIQNIIKQNEGESVLSLAARYNAPTDIIKQIIDFDLSRSLINKKHFDHTPLYYAVREALESKNNAIVELLLVEKANPNIGKDHPLSLAIEKLHPDLVQLLIKANAKPTKKMFTYVIKKIKKPYSKQEGPAAQETLLALIPSCKKLLEDNELLNQLIETALITKNRSLISFVHEQGISLQQPLNEEGESALHLAIAYRDSTAVDILLNAGYKPEALTTETEETPLHYAAWHEAKSNPPLCMKRLFAANVKVNKPNKNGDTALHKAARNNNCEGIVLLLAHGANPDIKNNNGKTAYESAEPEAKALFDAFALGKKQPIETQ